ncbi:MAG: hypothetical protein QOK00_3287 [Thermoleophilaceae bacterium]|nr:hypothetical protein [Thermoleophilaceae bacterium]MEA2402884.1 hypothetical protein [Thermoleophilaceae bacterium]MEA2454445.1 hypothetical protein [Thermoleophilaceae bacterium]
MELLRRRALDALAGRTIWSIAVLPTGRADADALQQTLPSVPTDAAQHASPGDLVLLHDAVAAVQAQAARDCGAHAILLLAPRFPEVAADAYVLAWSSPLSRGLVGDRLAAFMPSADLVAAFDHTREAAVPERPDEVSWNAVLAEVVQSDRMEAVGGRLHARPAVPLR